MGNGRGWEDRFTSQQAPVLASYLCNGARIPQLDEETGRIVQELRDGFRIIDTATLHMDSDEVTGSWFKSERDATEIIVLTMNTS